MMNLKNKLTYLQVAEIVLKSAKFPLSGADIWLHAVKNGLDKQLSSIGKTPIATLTAQLYVSVKTESKFMIASKRPTTFWLKSRQAELAGKQDSIFTYQEEQEKKEEKNLKFSERDLHPLLVKFLYESENFGLYCKTIYHEQSAKSIKGRDKWNYPDIVGMHFPFDKYEKQTFDLLNKLGKTSYKLYSFELKKTLTWGNLKEYYFQAVSNSSWANEGYLATFELKEDLIDEVIRLNASFGIGLIKLESEILESKVLVPARERELDIRTLDMLVEQNPNFKKFIENINGDMKHLDKRRIIKDNYDKVLNNDELEKYLKDKHIK